MHKHATKNGLEDNDSLPFLKMDLEWPNGKDWERGYNQQEVHSSKFQSSLKDDPSYLGKHINKATTFYVPCMSKLRLLDIDATNIKAVMSAPFACTLPLSKLVKTKPTSKA